MSAVVTASRKLTIAHDQKNQPITLAHLKALVQLADADGYPDESVVLIPQAPQGLAQLSIREGDA